MNVKTEFIIEQNIVIFPGPTLPTKCSLLIGHSVDAADIAHYFVGILDEVNIVQHLHIYVDD